MLLHIVSRHSTTSNSEGGETAVGKHNKPCAFLRSAKRALGSAKPLLSCLLFHRTLSGVCVSRVLSRSTVASRQIETTVFDPASVFLGTHWRASNPASEFLPKETCSFYKRDLFRRFSKTLTAVCEREREREREREKQ